MGVRTFVERGLMRINAFAYKETYRQWGRELDNASNKADYLEESLTTVGLELENLGYQQLNNLHSGVWRYSRRHVHNIIQLATHMAFKNPITARTVSVQADYVFGQGVSYEAKHPWVQQVVDEFINYPDNQKALTSHSSMLRAERRHQASGSMFFALFTNKITGRVIVRNLPTLHVEDIIRDPQDHERELYIKHRNYIDGVGTIYYHPILGIDEYTGVPAPWVIQGQEQVHERGQVLWNAPVVHMAFNKLGTEKFAMPELYPQLDWAIAYKRFLEDWTSIIRAFARMALKITGLAGSSQAAAAKAKLNTLTSLTQPLEKNPSTATASTGLFGKDVNVEAVKTAGATTAASEGDSILNMAGCGVGLPNTFYGDAGKGNFATAKTLDRPTELKMTSRQKLWIETLQLILNYVIDQSAIAPQGILALQGATYEDDQDVFTGFAVTKIIWPNNTDEQYGVVNQPIDHSVIVNIPDILERDVTDRVRALVNAFTLFGKPLTDIIPDKRLVATLLMQALKIPNPERHIPEFLTMWKSNMTVEPGQPAKEPYIIPPPAPAKPGGGAEDPSQGGAVGNNG